MCLDTWEDLPVCEHFGKCGQTDTEDCIPSPPDKNHSEERDNVSCLVSGLMRTSLGHPDVKPEVRCSREHYSPDSS